MRKIIENDRDCATLCDASVRAKEKQKPEFSDFDTSYKKYDKISEFAKEAKEEVVNHLTINLNNQKYLPKDYYDNPENKNFGERFQPFSMPVPGSRRENAGILFPEKSFLSRERKFRLHSTGIFDTIKKTAKELFRQ